MKKMLFAPALLLLIGNMSFAAPKIFTEYKNAYEDAGPATPKDLVLPSIWSGRVFHFYPYFETPYTYQLRDTWLGLVAGDEHPKSHSEGLFGLFELEGMSSEGEQDRTITKVLSTIGSHYYDYSDPFVSKKDNALVMECFVKNSKRLKGRLLLRKGKNTAGQDALFVREEEYDSKGKMSASYGYFPKLIWQVLPNGDEFTAPSCHAQLTQRPRPLKPIYERRRHRR